MKEKKGTIATDLVLRPALPSCTIYSPILSPPPSLAFYDPPPPLEFHEFLRYIVVPISLTLLLSYSYYLGVAQIE